MFNGIRPYPEIAVFTLYIISVPEIESVFVRISVSWRNSLPLTLLLHRFSIFFLKLNHLP